MKTIKCLECDINNSEEQRYCQNCGTILRPLNVEYGGKFVSGFQLSQMEEAEQRDW